MSTKFQAENVLDASVYLSSKSVLRLAEPMPTLSLSAKANINLKPQVIANATQLNFRPQVIASTSQLNLRPQLLTNAATTLAASALTVPPASISALNSQINKVRFINPTLATEISKISQPTQGVPRSQIKIPIAPQVAVVDTVLFDDPVDNLKKYYLPRYRVLELSRRPQISFKAADSAWNLVIQLEKYPASDLGSQASEAVELAHTASVLLQHRLVRGSSTGGLKELVFKEISVTQQGIEAVLPILSANERDFVYQILTDSEYGAALIVRRVVNVAIPVLSSSATISTAAKVSLGTRAFAIHNFKGINKKINKRLDKNRCFSDLSQPILSLKGTEEYTANGQNWKRYQLTVDNWKDFPEVLFAPAPDLPPCGRNKESSRTWIDIMSGSGQRLYGFCALSAPSQLQNLWFAHAREGAPPDAVYVVLNDRRCNQTYRTNTIRTVPGSGVALFRPVTRAVDDVSSRQPFVFPPELYPDVFREITGDTRRNFEPHLWQTPWERQSYSYYQDPVHHQLFYYLPDSFKVVRRPEAPFYPIFSVQFVPAGDTNGETLATVEYWAYPFIELKRLEAAATALKTIVPNLDEADTVEFQPLLAEHSQLSVHLPQANGTQKNEVRPEVVVDLRTGFRDSLTLTLENFQRFYDAIFGGSSVLFQGNVSVTLPNRPAENIPVRVQMDDLVGDLLSYQETAVAEAGTIQATLTNAIESPVQINQLQAVLHQGDKRIAADVEGVDFAAPVVLQPNEAIALTIVPSAPLADSDNMQVSFDLDRVEVLADKAAIWDVILRPDTPAEYQRLITVKTFKEVFGDRIKVISIDFRRAGTIDFTPDTDRLEATVGVLTPVRSLILREEDQGEENQGEYDYRVLVIYKDGQQAEDESWRTGSRESLWITSTDLPSGESR